jgi:hypothetical protein
MPENSKPNSKQTSQETFNKTVKSVIKFLFSIKEYLIIAAIYITLAVQKITKLGLNYDELLFTNVALGERTKDFFITHRFDFFGTLIPLHNYYYIGILKSILYWPIFAVFGTSSFIVRFPVVILTTFSLFLVFKILREYLPKKFALLITLITVLSTDLMFYTTYDVGPVAIEMFCKILLVLIMLGYLKAPKIWKILSFCLIFFLGTFNKVNFLWSGNAILATFAVVYLFNYFKIFRTLGKKLAISHLLVFFGGISLSYIYWRWCSNLYNWTTSLSLNSVLENYPVRSYSVFNMISGWNFFMWGMESGTPVFVEIFGLFTIIFSFLGFFTVLFHDRFTQIRQFFSLFYGLFWVIFVQQLATSSAGNPWHTFSSVFPFVPVCFGISIWAFWTLIFEEKKLNSISLFHFFNQTSETNSQPKDNLLQDNVKQNFEGKPQPQTIQNESKSEQKLKQNKFGNSLEHNLVKITRFQLATIATFVSFLLVFGYQLTVYSAYYKSLDFEPKNTAWSLVFHELSNYLKNQNKKVVATDWGLTSGLMTLDPIKQKYTDYWMGTGGDYNAGAFDGFKRVYLRNYQDYLVLSHGQERRMFSNNDNLEIFLGQSGFELFKVKSFVGGRGVQYELFEIRKI